MSLFFEAFEDFKNHKFMIGEVSFQLHGEGNGVGHAEGMVKYDAVLDNGEIIHFEGVISCICNVRAIIGIFSTL